MTSVAGPFVWELRCDRQTQCSNSIFHGSQKYTYFSEISEAIDSRFILTSPGLLDFTKCSMQKKQILASPVKNFGFWRDFQDKKLSYITLKGSNCFSFRSWVFFQECIQDMSRQGKKSRRQVILFCSERWINKHTSLHNIV